MKYVTSLVYNNPDVPESMNDPIFEPTKVQSLEKDTLNAVYELR